LGAILTGLARQVKASIYYTGIDQDCTVIRFNIPRPGMMNYFKELEE
jgi:hypothetical protein